MKVKLTIPCLIILDLNMPGLNGWDTFIEIKKDELLSRIPIVAFSTSNQLIDRSYFQLKGIEYIVKLFDFNGLLQAASRLLNISHK